MDNIILVTPTPIPYNDAYLAPLDISAAPVVLAQESIQGYHLFADTPAYDFLGVLLILLIIVGGMYSIMLHAKNDE